MIKVLHSLEFCMHQKTQRLVSLDIFRGLTIALMILVNSPGNQTPFSLLEHAEWNGCTFADLVFPFFIFIMGASAVFALTPLMKSGAHKNTLLFKIIRRTFFIFFMGIILNAFPKHLDFVDIRIMGVLQRIAICYFFTSLLLLTTSVRTQIIITLLILVSYGIITSYYDSYHFLGTIDKALFSSNHLYHQDFDPEGVLSTVPAIATALIGNMIGYFLLTNRTKKQHAMGLFFVGVLLTIMGGIMSYLIPLNKSIWSSSYVLWSGGIGLMLLAAIYTCIEMMHWNKWFNWLNLFGRHSLLVYMLHVIFLKIQAIIMIKNVNGQTQNLRLYLSDTLFGYFPPQIASLCYSISYTLIWLLFLFFYEEYSIKPKYER